MNDTGKISRPCIRSHPIRPCVENDTKEISPAGLAESLCAPPSPRSFQNLVFYFQILVFFFEILVSSVQKSGSRGSFPMPKFKVWLSIFKIWVSSVGDLGIRGDENYDFDFSFQARRYHIFMLL